MSHKPAGGPKSKNVVEPRVRTGTGSKGTRAAGTAQIGLMYGDHVTHRGDSTGYTGEKLHNDRNFQPVKFGNEVALNVGKGGCGTGRTIHERGSQDMHGSAAGSRRPAGRGILTNE
jgi:hypothetical protein